VLGPLNVKGKVKILPVRTTKAYRGTGCTRCRWVVSVLPQQVSPGRRSP